MDQHSRRARLRGNTEETAPKPKNPAPATAKPRKKSAAKKPVVPPAPPPTQEPGEGSDKA
jgi:hypothetical protein